MRTVLEISGNHGGHLAQCRKLIADAKKLKPSSIKFQCFEADALAIKRQDNPEVAAAVNMVTSTAKERRLHLLYLYTQTCTPKRWWRDILDELGGYPWSSSVFSIEDLAFCEARECPAYKVASFELHDLDLIAACAATKKPLTLSVNAAAQAWDVQAAIRAAGGGLTPLTLLHASAYARRKAMTSADLQHERERYLWLCAQAPPHIEVGLSDHSPPTEHWLLDFAIDKDCDMVERHIRLAEVRTPDSAFSSTARQLSKYLERMKIRAQARTKLETATR